MSAELLKIIQISFAHPRSSQTINQHLFLCNISSISWAFNDKPLDFPLTEQSKNPLLWFHNITDASSTNRIIYSHAQDMARITVCPVHTGHRYSFKKKKKTKNGQCLDVTVDASCALCSQSSIFSTLHSYSRMDSCEAFLLKQMLSWLSMCVHSSKPLNEGLPLEDIFYCIIAYNHLFTQPAGLLELDGSLLLYSSYSTISTLAFRFRSSNFTFTLDSFGGLSVWLTI